MRPLLWFKVHIKFISPLSINVCIITLPLEIKRNVLYGYYNCRSGFTLGTQTVASKVMRPWLEQSETKKVTLSELVLYDLSQITLHHLYLL